MSVVVCVRRASETVLASDSGCFSGDLRVPNATGKVVEANGVLIGHTGDAVTLDALRAYFDDTKAYFKGVAAIDDVFRFGLAFRKWLKESAHLVDEKPSTGSAFAHLGNSFILVMDDGAAFVLGGDLSVDEIPVGSHWAIGSGREIALGALHVLRTQPMTPERMAVEAVEAACALMSTCDPPAMTWKRAPAIKDGVIKQIVAMPGASAGYFRSGPA